VFHSGPSSDFLQRGLTISSLTADQEAVRCLDREFAKTKEHVRSEKPYGQRFAFVLMALSVSQLSKAKESYLDVLPCKWKTRNKRAGGDFDALAERLALGNRQKKGRHLAGAENVYGTRRPG